MKKLSFALFLLAFSLYGEVTLKNSILSFPKAGAKMVPYTQTVKWISPEERAAKSTALSDGKDNALKYETILPGASAEVKILTSLIFKADKQADYSVVWEAKSGGDIKEKFLFINLPLNSVKDKKFIFNGREVPVVSVKKPAWFQLRNQVISMTFFKGEEGKEFTLTSKGKIRISCETHPAANRVWVRIYPVAPQDKIEFTVKAE